MTPWNEESTREQIEWVFSAIGHVYEHGLAITGDNVYAVLAEWFDDIDSTMMDTIASCLAMKLVEVIN